MPIRNHAGDVCIVKVQALGHADEPEFLVSGETDQDEMMKEIKRIFQWEHHLQHVLDHFQKRVCPPFLKSMPGHRLFWTTVCTTA